MIQWTEALLWGLFATGVMTVILAASQGFGWTRISLPFMLGTALTARRSRAVVLGFLLHIAIGCGFGLLYAMVYESWGSSGWWRGALLGFFHGSFMLTVFVTMLPDVHPRMAGRHHGPTPTRQLEPPGFLALNYGPRTPLVTMLSHVIYGVILGTFYSP